MLFANFMLFGFVWGLECTLFMKYLTQEHDDTKRTNSIEEFELRYIDLFWKHEASWTDDNENIYIVKHM